MKMHSSNFISVILKYSWYSWLNEFESADFRLNHIAASFILICPWKSSTVILLLSNLESKLNPVAELQSDWSSCHCNLYQTMENIFWHSISTYSLKIALNRHLHSLWDAVAIPYDVLQNSPQGCMAGWNWTVANTATRKKFIVSGFQSLSHFAT